MLTSGIRWIFFSSDLPRTLMMSKHISESLFWSVQGRKFRWWKIWNSLGIQQNLIRPYFLIRKLIYFYLKVKTRWQLYHPNIVHKISFRNLENVSYYYWILEKNYFSLKENLKIFFSRQKCFADKLFKKKNSFNLF